MDFLLLTGLILSNIRSRATASLFFSVSAQVIANVDVYVQEQHNCKSRVNNGLL